MNATAQLIANEQATQLKAWLRKGCPGQAHSLAEHIDLVQSMNDARQAILEHEHIEQDYANYYGQESSVQEVSEDPKGPDSYADMRLPY